MRLYSLTEAASVDDPAFGHFEAGDDGGFDFPGPLADHLHASHVAGQKQWETQIERGQRLIAEEHARRQSPEALYEAVSKLVELGQLAQPPAAPADRPVRQSRGRPASKP